MMKYIRVIIIIFLSLLVLYLYWYFYWRYFQTTNNAYVQTNNTHINARVSSVVLESNIQDNHKVKKGDFLVQLDEREFMLNKQKTAAALEQNENALINAQASYQMQKNVIEEHRSSLISAKASLKYARQQLDRYQLLKEKRYVSQSDVDNVISNYKIAESRYGEAQAKLKTQISKLVVQDSQLKQAKANVQQAMASLNQAELMLSYTRIAAPNDGVISNRSVQVGTMVQAGQGIASIVSNQTSWIQANFKETQISRMHKGQPVKVSIDAYPDKIFHAKIDSISPATGAIFALLPPNNATGNFTKVVQRLSVKIVFDQSEEIDSGLSATVTVDTR
ncbi:HlyD family secretion protein [Xenorhabdus bovienii]|uniref:Multidrug resistance protein A n=1 Tax=Xenorhabdus bovienii str. kraussei Becker Underwood TaxID=1398204 RepID=A0A077PKQ2_XENBV|nr:HlyD family secretion protein [Xenorhabdus bovienii]CDH24985.1 Multidrug resistance protein A [Xenorhabdus bovienii str. kraussei Becker Underwood]